jgi:hypothetical protein
MGDRLLTAAAAIFGIVIPIAIVVVIMWSNM